MSSVLNDDIPNASLVLHLPAGLQNSAEARAVAKAMAAQVWACDESEFELVFEPRVLVPETAQVEGVPVSIFQSLKAKAIQNTKRRLWVLCFIAMVIALGWGTLIWKGEKRHAVSQKLLNESTAKLKSWTDQEGTKNSLRSEQDRVWGVLKPQLEVDLNPVFNTIETIKLPQVRLRSFEMDATTRTAVLIYELPNMGLIGELHKALSQEANEMMCQLINIQSTNPVVSAQWRCTF